jgi:hypothetical protein
MLSEAKHLDLHSSLRSESGVEYEFKVNLRREGDRSVN